MLNTTRLVAFSGWYLLLRKVLGDVVLIDDLPTLKLLPFDFLNALTLDIAGTDEHALEGTETEVIMALG